MHSFHRRFSHSILLIILIGLQFGCQGDSIPKGRFQGTLLQSLQGRLQEKLVAVEIFYTSKREGQVEVTDLQGVQLFTIQARQLNKSLIEVDLPVQLNLQIDETPQSRTIRLHEDQGCFVSRLEKKIQLCFNRDRFSIEVTLGDGSPVFGLTADRFNHEQEFVVEESRDFGLRELVEAALEKNFDSRIQFEHLIQAKRTARASYLNILPHLTFSSVLSAAVSGTQGLLSSVGDLAPFLFPTRWFHAKQADLKSSVERDALMIMRVDLANQIEGLSYVHDRDREILRFYEAHLGRARSVKELASALERQGKFQDGAGDDLQSLINSMLIDIVALKATLQIQRISLSQAIGAHHPNAVASLLIGEELEPLETAVALDSEATGRIAVERSFELRQMDALIKIANSQKVELYFNWLDPNGDPNAPLGFGLHDLIQVAKSKVTELKIKREQLEALVLQKTYESVAAYDGVLQAVVPIFENVSLQERRLSRVTKLIQPGSSLNPMDIVSVFQDLLAAKVRLESSRASYRIARSKLDRLQLKGYYRIHKAPLWARIASIRR